MKRLRDTERGDKMKVIWESNLQIEKMRSSAERAILCQKSRGFKTTIEKNMKKCLMQWQWALVTCYSAC